MDLGALKERAMRKSPFELILGPKLKLLKEHFGDSRKQEYDEGVAFLVGFRTCLDFEGRGREKEKGWKEV